jgi:D-alanine-D-alanine ligase
VNGQRAISEADVRSPSSGRAALARHAVAVLMGGRSSEREVSLWSGRAVHEALARASSEPLRVDPSRVHAVEISSGGTWIVDGRERASHEAVAELGSDCVYFLALHGGEGEDGTVQGFLRALGRVHTGSGVEASALCMNKHHTRLVLESSGLRVARGALVTHARWREDRDRVLREIAELSTSGYSVKPCRGGSSVATSLFDDAKKLAPAIDAVFATGDEALVEERIRGAEATCGVLGNSGGELRALTPVEIVPKEGRFFDYQEKYAAGGAEEHCPPKTLSATTTRRIRELATRAHAAAGCDGYSRVDFMVPRGAGGEDGEPVVLEINTLPGMTARSLLPLAARAEGLDFRALCIELLALALDRHATARDHDAEQRK